MPTRPRGRGNPFVSQSSRSIAIHSSQDYEEPSLSEIESMLSSLSVTPHESKKCSKPQENATANVTNDTTINHRINISMRLRPPRRQMLQQFQQEFIEEPSIAREEPARRKRRTVDSSSEDEGDEADIEESKQAATSN